MSNFFTTSDGVNAAQVGTEFDAGGGDFEPIPAGTTANAIVEEAKWETYEGERYINLRWTVLAPDAYKNRKVFQKVKVYNPEPKKADKAKRMLAAIDANAGGGLITLGREPSEEDLMMNLLNKPMLIKLQIWKSDDKQGNWVAAVSSGKLPQSQTLAEATGDDTIPF